MYFPPLYECSVCGCSVHVTVLGEGLEPVKTFSCGHTDAIIYANRKVTLRAEGGMSFVEKASTKITLSLRQILSSLTNRSI